MIVKNNIVAREGSIAGLRRAPDSYTSLYYYTQLVRHWTAVDGTEYLARFRMYREGQKEHEQPGIPTDADAASFWHRERLLEEKRPRDYLRQELKDRLAGETTCLRLEVQLHRPSPEDELWWYYPSVDWPQDEDHRWRLIGRAYLTDSLEDRETERLGFSSSHAPPSLAVPRATSMLDPRSLADSERRIGEALRNLRYGVYRVRGLPPFGEENE